MSSIIDGLGLEVIHVDGKTAKGSYDRKGKLKSLHSVSAWSREHGLVLAQQKVDDKSNEIKAVLLLLKLLNLKGAVVTLNAMGTQTEIATQIKQAEGVYEYLLVFRLYRMSLLSFAPRTSLNSSYKRSDNDARICRRSSSLNL